MSTWSHDAKLDAIDRAPLRAFVPMPDTRIVDEPDRRFVITPSRAEGAYNEVAHFSARGEDADAAIDAILAEYRLHEVPHKWSVGPRSSPADLAERLRARGMLSWWARGMCCDTSLPIKSGPGVTVTRAAPDERQTLYTTMARGWDRPLEWAERELSRVLAERADTHLLYLARVDGEPAGAAGVVLLPSYGYLVSAVVLPELRGRGVYRALVAARLQRLVESGRDLAVTQAREASSAPILERLGFETVYRFRMCATPDAAAPGAE